MKLHIPTGPFAYLEMDQKEMDELREPNKLTQLVKHTKLITDLFSSAFPVVMNKKYDRKPQQQPKIHDFAKKIFSCPLPDCGQVLVSKISKERKEQYYKDDNPKCDYFLMGKQLIDPTPKVAVEGVAIPVAEKIDWGEGNHA